jgi:hypothetical protein
MSGIVRRISVTAGGQIHSGDVVMQVDSVTRVAWHADAPFYRDLAFGDSGDDVSSLNQLLASRSLPNDLHDKFGRATQAGVAQLATALGAARGTRTFSASWVVFVPSEVLTVDSVDAVVGAPAPVAGEPIFEVAPTVTTAHLTSPAASSGIATSPHVSKQETLRVAGEAISLEPNGSVVDGEGLTVLSSLADPKKDTVVGTLSRSVAGGTVEIPAAAVHTSPNGKVCVAVRSRSGAVTTKMVEVVAGTSGRVSIVGDVKVEDQVGLGVFKAGASCD